jgi:hypothetical protein
LEALVRLDRGVLQTSVIRRRLWGAEAEIASEDLRLILQAKDGERATDRPSGAAAYRIPRKWDMLAGETVPWYCT